MLCQALRRSSVSVVGVKSRRMKFNQVSLLAATTLLSPTFTTPTRAFSILPPNKTTMESLDIKFQNTWIEQLSPETPENLKKSRNAEGMPDSDTNQTRRQVFNGHYVMVKPTGLREPRLMLISEDVAKRLLHLTDQQINSQDFLNYVSGNLEEEYQSWATPYALSIMGTRYTSNCPFGTGNGYGDGRAVSIGEFQNHELQLKGGGTTPFHRGADGRAVLRSSIREFLASEAMHHLNIRTTRALSLIVSEKDTVNRAWYSQGAKLALPSPDDPRLANYTEEERRTLLMQLRNEKVDPNIMVKEPCAITCRVAPSFVRIGHLDLFARRVEKLSQTAKVMFSDSNKPRYDQTTQEFKELQDLVWHACYREFRDEAYTPFYDKGDIASAATVLLEQSADRLSDMIAGWIRVGFAQGNFNADNCLVGGHTMDYGPFGFMEEYNPLFAKWTGSGEHFGFMNQPTAGFVNYQVLVESVVPVISAATGNEDSEALAKEFLLKAKPLFEDKVNQVFRSKMGFSDDMEIVDDLWQTLQMLMRLTRVDWTLFWRQLSMVAAEYDDYEDDNFEGMLEVLIGEGITSPFYETLTKEHREQYFEWIKRWRSMLIGEKDIAERMRMANPKYVLREWMLVNAYSQAAKGEECDLRDLFALIQTPYDEGTPDQAEKFYRRTPEESHLAGGTAFMS